MIQEAVVMHQRLPAMRHPHDECMLSGLKIIGRKDYERWNVRACNAHDDLVAALEKLADEATSIGQHITGQAGMQAMRFGETIKEARATLAKAQP